MERTELYRTISQNGFRLSADEVLSVSRQLDELILEFYKKKEIGATERSYPG